MMAEYFNSSDKSNKFCIAGLKVYLEYEGERLSKQISAYFSDWEGDADIEIRLNKARMEKICADNSHLPKDACEYAVTGSDFYLKLIDYNGFMLHSSAVIYDGKAYLFSAPCGTGKSTHTSIWQKRFGEKAVILNDDKPAIRLVDGTFYAYGTPWSGKTDKQVNVCAPIAGIAFIERAEKNNIRAIDKKEAIVSILSQTVRPKDEKRADKLLEIIGSFVEKVNVYTFGCNMELDAADVAYNTMSKNS